jgi:hypothetical protein
MNNGPANRLAWPTLCFVLAALGCDQPRASSRADGTNATSAAASATPASTKVTRIVFVGKEHPCDCTRKTIDAGWAALQQALGTPPKMPIERLQIDTQPDKVEPYRNQKPFLALPAIYFVDGKSAVLDLVQGEVTAEQIAPILNR